jgi:ubiquinone/menaquinone biosynthesis C-methylase UbiE
MPASQYPIKTTADEFARLEIQSNLFRDDARSMLAKVGDGSGWRALDLCCGTGGITDVLSEWVGQEGSVVGADLDTAKLDHAKHWIGQLGLTNVEFVQANAFDSGLAPDSFDLVHARFALSVIQNGMGILDHMLTLVRPGGVVFVEEVNTNTMECAPSTADWEQVLKLAKDTFLAIGANTALGLSLREVFMDKGLSDIQVKPCLHALTADDPMTMHLPLTLTAMRETITSMGLMEGIELDDLVARVTDHLEQQETMTISFCMVQLVGRVSG